MTFVLVWRLVSLFSCCHRLRSLLSWSDTYHKLGYFHFCRHCHQFRDYCRHLDRQHYCHYRRRCSINIIASILFETCRCPCRSVTADTSSITTPIIITTTATPASIYTSPTSFRDAFHASNPTTSTAPTPPDTSHVHLRAIPTTTRTLRDKVQSSLRDISNATLAYFTTNINNATISTTVPNPLTKTFSTSDSSTDTITTTTSTPLANPNTSRGIIPTDTLGNITPSITITTTITSFTTTESLGTNCTTNLYNPSFPYNINPDTDLVYPYSDPGRLPGLRHSPAPNIFQTPGGATRAQSAPQLPPKPQSVHPSEDTIEYPKSQEALPSTPTYSHPQSVPEDVTHSIYLYSDPISFPHIQPHFSTYTSTSSPQLGPNNNTSSPHVFGSLPAPVPTHGTIRPDTNTGHYSFSEPSLPYPVDNPSPQQHLPPPLLSSPQDLFAAHHRPQQPHPAHFDDDEHHHHSAPPSPHAPAHAPSHTWIMVAREMIRQSSLTRLGLMINTAVTGVVSSNNNKKGNGDIQWCFSQVKGTLDDDVSEADIISCVEFSHDGDLLATGDKGGRVVIFQRDPASKNCLPRRGEYNVYSTFQSHEPEFDYLKSLEIEEKINKIRWLKRKNPAHFLLSTNDKTIKLWKVSERDKRAEGYNLRDESGTMRDPSGLTALRVPVLKPMELMVEASPRRIFANAHTYHINSISINSDQETYLSADDLRINLWHLEVTDQSFNIVDIKPTNMEELTEVITAAEFHPQDCNVFVYSSSKGTIRLCDMRAAALCDSHAKLFEEPEDPTNRSFFSEIISSISDVKFSNSGRYMISRDYLSVKVWDLHMETKPIETYPVHEYLRSKLCSLYENDCIFDKFECCWSGNDSAIMTGSYNNFFRMFDRTSKRDATLEASRETAKPRTILKPRRVCTGGKRKKDEISVDCLDFNKKILHTAWHPHENIIAVAATNNLYIFQDKF